MMGMHGEAFVNTAIQEADLLLAFGMRFDDRVTGKLATYAQRSKKIHVEIDPSEIGKNVPVDVAHRGRPARGARGPAARASRPSGTRRGTRDRRAAGRDPRAGHPRASRTTGSSTPRTSSTTSGRPPSGGAVVVTDVGQHQMWEAQYYRHEKPRTLITSGGLGTMGFALPAAIGAKMARPEAEVWVIAGDGGFQMTQCELATLQQEKLDIKIAVINNGYLGMVRQWQEFFYDKRYAATPDPLPRLREAGRRLRHRRPSRDPALGGRLHRAGGARVRAAPALIDFRVEKEEAVYPMVPAGADLHAMIRRPADVVEARR